MNDKFFKIKDLLKYDKQNFKILIGGRSVGVKYAIEQERYKKMTKIIETKIIEEYEEMIKRAIAICIDFKIPFERVFKEKYLLNEAYKMVEDTNNLYTFDYQMQKCYNELYKKISKPAMYQKIFQYIYMNIVDIYINISITFNCDIIKLIKQYKDVKKCAR